MLAVVLKVRYLTDAPRSIRALVPGWNNGGKIKGTIRPMKSTPGRQSAPDNSSFRERRAAEARERSLASTRRRRPSISNIAIDDTIDGWATKDGLLTTGQVKSQDVSFSSSRSASFGGPSGGSPEMGQRALRGQSGFQFQVLGAPPMLPQNYQAPSQAYAPMGAPASTVQAQAMQAVLQRVQELVIAHSSVPSNAAHWSAVLETASGASDSGKLRARQAKINEYELELASSMSKLAQARAEVLQLAATEKDTWKDKGGEAEPPRGGDDAQEEEPAATRAPSWTKPTCASAPSPQQAQSAWLHASLQSEEEDTSTPASPLLDPPTAPTLLDPRGGDLRVGLPLRPQFAPSRPDPSLSPRRATARRQPPVEFVPRVLEEACGSNPCSTRRNDDPMRMAV